MTEEQRALLRQEAEKFHVQRDAIYGQECMNQGFRSIDLSMTRSDWYELMAMFAEQKLAEARAEQKALLEGANLAKRLTSTDGHEHGCGFRGCSCGAADAYKAARTDFVRWLNSTPIRRLLAELFPEASPCIDSTGE
jgi:hypothetical protein